MVMMIIVDDNNNDDDDEGGEVEPWRGLQECDYWAGLTPSVASFALMPAQMLRSKTKDVFCVNLTIPL